MATRLIDCAVTSLLWLYFTLGFCLLFAPRYIWAAIFAKKRQETFQRLNHSFFHSFFQLLHHLAPKVSWDIDPKINKISGSIIVCNHISYLDPILLISLLPQAKTIVKPSFFKVPIFATVLNLAGYFPSPDNKKSTDKMLNQIDQMANYLKNGGNLFIFPEGTRSRTGKIGHFKKGALKLARLYQAPIIVIRLQGTNRLFAPGHFLFSTGKAISIRANILANIPPGPQLRRHSLAQKLQNLFAPPP